MRGLDNLKCCDKKIKTIIKCCDKGVVGRRVEEMGGGTQEGIHGGGGEKAFRSRVPTQTSTGPGW